ncbi:hypothetical protein RND81_06G034000 [Saponaria officinalis]|uniref:Protein kinase domain-containing protein n=1 Tax=Saponaria officinalis TaxID=3572 RepID=A0AAW1K9A1_SAPOF
MEFMEFVRGPMVGRGSFATVNLVTPTKISPQFSPTMVVKSSPISNSNSLKTEREVFSDVGNCPEIVRFLGDSTSYEHGNKLYNLFFEFAQKGSLENQLRNSGGKFNDFEIRKYTKSILRGLDRIHSKGYTHCDIKLSNILLFDNDIVKIADFGLATKNGDKNGYQLKGTPLYMSPELVAGGELLPAVDVWAVGCAVVEMFTGRSVWEVSPECDVSSLIFRIGVGKESPQVPLDICLDGKDFISKCFIKDPSKRWTVRMLLDHPFISGFDDVDQEVSVSPRDPFEFSDLEFSGQLSFDQVGFSGFDFVEQSSLDMFEDELGFGLSEECWRLGHDRVWEMAGDVEPDWSNSDGWINVR